MNTIPAKDLEKAASELPTSPQIFGKLGALLKDPEVDFGEITELVRTDSSLTTATLCVSNSAMYKTGESIDSLDEAIGRIGLNELFRLVGNAAAKQIFHHKNATYSVSGDRLWENSLACALAMEKLASFIGKDPREAYTIGLLRSIGKMVIDTCVGENDDYPCFNALSGVKLIDWEKNNFGVTNPTVSSYVLSSWNFSDLTCYTIQHQYEPEGAPDENPMVYMINLANRIAADIGKPIEGENYYWEITESRLDNACLNLEEYEQVREGVIEKLDAIISSIYLPHN